MQSTVFKKTIVFFLIAAMMCTLFAGCAEKKPNPEDTVMLLQDAINKLDVEELLKCIDSKWASKIKTILTFTIGKGDVSVETVLTLAQKIMPILPFVSDGAITSDELPQVKFTVLDTKVSDKTATVAISGVLTCGEYSKTFTATIDMKLEKEMWVVCGIRG